MGATPDLQRCVGVTGSGFIVLIATLSSIETIPVEGILLIFDIDKFVSKCQALTHVCYNFVSSIFFFKRESQWDDEYTRTVLDSPEGDLQILTKEEEGPE